MGHLDSVKVTHGKSGSLYDGALISEIEHTMEELSNNLLHGIEGISARLLQLESRTQKIENAVDDLKYSAGYNFGRTDGKLRQIENILLEVYFTFAGTLSIMMLLFVILAFSNQQQVVYF